MRFAPAIGGEQLLFDFDKFSSITASVYADSPYSLAEVLEVFRHYFEQYEAYKRQVVARALGERFEGKIADEVYENARDNLMRNIRIVLQQQGMSWEDYVNQNGGEQQINMMLMLQTREMVVQGYALDAVFRHAKLGISEDDINEACHMMAPNANPKQVRQQVENEGKGFVLRESAERLKANKWAAEQAKVTIQEQPQA